jgi:hypothetical protein
LEHVINMGLIEDLAGRGINRALQMSTAGISDEQYKDMVETMYETGGAIQDLADMLADRKLSPEEIDTLVREAIKNVNGIQLEATRSAIERIISGIANRR